MNISVVLINPLYQGNVGAIARSMANFDLSELIIVGDFSIGDEARCRAKHANSILDNVSFCESFDLLKNDFDLIIGTTGIIGTDYNIPRSPLTLCETSCELKDFSGRVALVFGSEATGLSNEHLLLCDFTLHIPTSVNYSVLNLSHAASIVFYEFFKLNSSVSGFVRENHVIASSRERDEAVRIVDDVVGVMSFKSESDRDTQRVVWRRILGKSFLTRRELFSVIGFFRNVLFEYNKKKK
ncbi:MAG: RNA methyltransferase [Candidatus Woesearchaeota archaeon]